MWTSSAVSSDLQEYERNLFRFIDPDGAQGILDLVDNTHEADILEGILYRSREVVNNVPPRIHRLLARPFELHNPLFPSRFRSGYQPGVLYSAESISTAALERGYQKVRFLRETPELEIPSLQRQTLINFDVRTEAIDIRVAPYSAAQYELASPTSYVKSQEFTVVARESGAGAIIYSSARGACDGPCVAVLRVDALKNGQPKFLSYAWEIRATSERAMWVNSETSEKLEFIYP